MPQFYYATRGITPIPRRPTSVVYKIVLYKYYLSHTSPEPCPSYPKQQNPHYSSAWAHQQPRMFRSPAS
jgi:hypothetical protein